MVSQLVTYEFVGGWCAAPEAIMENYKEYDGSKVDVWACGVLLYVMLFRTCAPAGLEHALRHPLARQSH